MNEKKEAIDVFTPASSATLSFVEREVVNNQLADAIHTPGKQIILYGQSGAGKTTLIFNKLNQTYSSHITVSCSALTSFEDILYQAFDLLDPFFTENRGSKRSSTMKSSISSNYLKIKSIIDSSNTNENTETLRRALPLQLTPLRLAEFLGVAEACLVLEDFHEIKSEEKIKLAKSLKSFKDASDRFRDVKVILVGATGSAKEVIDYDLDMRGRIAEIYLPLMSEEELIKIIELGEKELNLDFKEQIKNDIIEYSSGIAAVTHQLCLYICQNAGIYETCDEKFIIDSGHLYGAISSYISGTPHSVRSHLENALEQDHKSKYENRRIILTALSMCNANGVKKDFLYNKIIEKNPDYPSSNLTRYLNDLTNEGTHKILTHNRDQQTYSFISPIYRTYAQMHFVYNADDKIETTDLSDYVETIASILYENMSVIPSANIVAMVALRLFRAKQTFSKEYLIEIMEKINRTKR